MGARRVRAGYFAEIALGQGDDRICIAVLDGPVDLSHRCFLGAKLTQLETLVRSGAPGSEASAHGTHVASVIFGQPGSAVGGIAPSCRGLIVPIFADEGHGASLSCSQLDLARAIALAIENGAHVINISGGQLTPSSEPEPVLAQAIESCKRHNVLIVAAAGNDGCECLHVPAAAPSVLAVGAMDGHGSPLMSSNWGGAYRTQGILAPGVDVLGAVPGGGTVRKSGTSFATPFVSGLIGLLASLQLKRGDAPDPHAIRTAVLKAAVPCVPDTFDDCRKYLSGRLNIPEIVKLIERGDKLMTDAETILTSENSVSGPEGSAPLRAPAPAPDRTIRMSSDAASEQAVVGSGSAPDPVTARQELPAPALRRLGQVTMSDCGCGGGANCTCGGAIQKPALVYALGKIGYDFGSEARRDSFTAAMRSEVNNPLIPDPEHANPLIPDQLLGYIGQHPYDASPLIWTLNVDVTPIYAVQPAGPFAATGYERLREFLHSQLHEGVELVSVPGVIVGSVRLQSGQDIPIIVPSIRGMYSWATRSLVEHVLGPPPEGEEELQRYTQLSSGLSDFLDRVYYDLRNLGITAEERALNYSATNAVRLRDIISDTTTGELDLDKVILKKSPVCRPDSDCYDVELLFFNPIDGRKAKRVFRFTVDVSDVNPVMIGEVRKWTRPGQSL